MTSARGIRRMRKSKSWLVSCTKPGGPLIYIGDGVWKSGAQAAATELAERFGASIASTWNDLRGVSAAHPLHCGYLRGQALDIEPDRILCLGVRHGGMGSREDFAAFSSAEKLAAVGSDVAVFKNIPGVDLAVFADEKRTVERLNELVRSEYEPARYTERRAHARSAAASLRADRRTQLQSPTREDGHVRPLALLDAIASALEREGGGIVTTEQFAIPLECVNAKEGGGSVTYVRPAGGSEGYGVGAAMGAKLAAPDMPVVGSWETAPSTMRTRHSGQPRTTAYPSCTSSQTTPPTVSSQAHSTGPAAQ